MKILKINASQNKNKRGKSHIKAILMSFILLATMGINCQETFAQLNMSDNIQFGTYLPVSFKYEKTIDMTNAEDRTQIPNARFEFTMFRIPDEDKEKYSIGQKYQSFIISRDDDGKETDRSVDEVQIVQGGFLNNKTKCHFSTVEFNKKNLNFQGLADKMDEGADAEEILNDIISNYWGRMRSSDHIQTVWVRKATPEEEEYNRKHPSKGWPVDMIPIRGFNENTDDESNVMYLRELMNRNDKYSLFFDLRANPAVTYMPYDVNPPSGYLNRAELDENGLYNSVTKALFSSSELEKIEQDLMDYIERDNYGYINDTDEGTDGVNYHSRTKIYRYLVKETDAPQEFKKNNQTLILDFVTSLNGNYIVMFQDIDQANEYYQNKFVGEVPDNFSSRSSLPASGAPELPKAVFLNKYKDKNVYISKIAVGGNKELPGAKLAIHEGDTAKGKIVESWTSGTKKHSVNLKAGTYTLTEEAPPSGYKTAHSITFRILNNGEVEIRNADGEFVKNDDNTVIMEDEPINRPPKPPISDPPVPEDKEESIDIRVNKVWEGKYDNNSEITVNLYMNGKQTVENVKLNKENNWTGVFENLPKYDKDNNDAAINYTVEEEGVRDGIYKTGEFSYEVKKSGDMESGFTIHNKLISPTKVPPTNVPPTNVPIIPNIKGGKAGIPLTGDTSLIMPLAGIIIVCGFFTGLAICKKRKANKLMKER